MANENKIMHIGMEGLVMFLSNVRPNFIKDVWGFNDEHTTLSLHLVQKLNDLIEEDGRGFATIGVMAYFFFELSAYNRTKLFDHIIEHHT